MKKLTKEQFKEKAKAFCGKWVRFFLNPRLLLCVFIAWMITNGWCYVFVFVGTTFGITWMTVAGAAYMSFLWFPFTPEKVVTLIIAIALMRALFPKDEKTLGVLRQELEDLKRSLRAASEKRREKRRTRKARKSVDNSAGITE